MSEKNIIGVDTNTQRLFRSIDVDDVSRSFSTQSIFFRPAYLQPSAWIEHIPFAFWIIEIQRPRVFVELGTHYGTSYFAFCQAIERLALASQCFAIDTWRGDDHSGFYGAEVFEQVKDLNDSRYSGFSSLVRSTFAEALPHFTDGTIDLLHIDGLHTLDAVSQDFHSWLPKLSNHAVVLLHDTNVRERDFGVFALFERLSKEYPSFEFLHGHGLGIVGVGKEQKELLKHLFDANGDRETKRAVRDIFSRLGRSCADEFSVLQLKERNRDLTSELETNSNRLDEIRHSFEKKETETSILTKELADARSELQAMIEQNAVERGQLSERVDLLRNAREQLKEEVRRQQDQLTASLLEVTQRSEDLMRIRSINDEHQETIKTLRQTLSASEHTVAQLKTELARYEQEGNTLRRSMNEKERTLSELETAKLELQKSLDHRIAECRTINASFLRQVAENDSLRHQLSALSQKYSAARAYEDKLAKARTKLKEKATEQIHSASAFAELQAKVLHSTQEAKSVREKMVDQKNVHEQELATISGQIKHKDTKLAQLAAIRADLQSQNDTLRRKIEERFTELATMTQLLMERDLTIKKQTERLAIFRRELARSRNSVFWRMTQRFHAAAFLFNPAGRKQRRDVRKEKALIAKSGLFDVDWYLNRNPDVAAAGADPIEHYIHYGANEGRDPGPSFNTKWYSVAYTDVADSGINPLVHYINHGKQEGRSTHG